jgi:hypothetical protein
MDGPTDLYKFNFHSRLHRSLSDGGAHAPPNFQTGMPSFFALSARLSWMPVPGKYISPIGRTSSMASFRLNGAALACFVQSGLKAICGTLRLSAHLAAISSAPFGDPPWTLTGG